MTDKFDFDKALEALRFGKDLTGKDGVLTPLIKQLTEAALSAELDQHLADDSQPNDVMDVAARPSSALPVASNLKRPVIAPVRLNLSW